MMHRSDRARVVQERVAMTASDPARTLEHFRHRTLAELEHQLDVQHLPRDEYDRRVSLALRASTPSELKPLVSDLIAAAGPADPARLSGGASAGDGGTEYAFALMSGSVREGSWEPAETIHALAIMGHVRLDFRDASLLEGTTTVHAFAAMGGITVIAPPDVHVSVSGIGLMGGFGRIRRSAPHPDAPRIHVDGLAIMGGVEVKVREPGDRLDDDAQEAG
jgi:hypothetical protein